MMIHAMVTIKATMKPVFASGELLVPPEPDGVVVEHDVEVL
jgi:hypothetical protein